MIAILDTIPHPFQEQAKVITPFGAVPYALSRWGDHPILHLPLQPTPPQPTHAPALAYAAKTLGAERVLAVIRDNQLATPCTPADFIEFTRDRFTTFFDTIGTGYVQQVPPFCPELRAALMQGSVKEVGTLLVTDMLPAPAIAQWWQSQGVALISTLTQPEGALCRELELCFAVLAVPETAVLEPVLTAVLPHLPPHCRSGCDETMAFARKMGKLPENWQDWFSREIV